MMPSSFGPIDQPVSCIKEELLMSAPVVPDRFTTLPDEHALQATVVALEEHGFSVEVVDDLDAARQAVLARIPEGSSVMTNTSVTLTETGIADAINDGGDRWESAPEQDVRPRLRDPGAGDEGDRRPTGLRPWQRARGDPRPAPWSSPRRQAASLPPTPGAPPMSSSWSARRSSCLGWQRRMSAIYQHSLPLEDVRAQAAYGQHSQVGKVLEIHQELPGRVHIVLIRQSVGF